MSFDFIQPYLSSPSLGRTCCKVKTCNQKRFFTQEYMRACDELDTVTFNYPFKSFHNLKHKTNKYKYFVYK